MKRSGRVRIDALLLAAGLMLVAVGPQSHVEMMHVLLGDLVAREPHEVVPVVHLEFHFGRFTAQTLGELLA